MGLGDDSMAVNSGDSRRAPPMASGLRLTVQPSLEERGCELMVDEDAVAGAARVRVREARYGSGQVRLTAIECEAVAEVLLSAARTWQAKQPRLPDPGAAESSYVPESEDGL